MMDWNIQPRSETCQATGRPFAEGEEFFTLLFQTAEGYRRVDLCAEAFAARDRQEVPVSFWKSEFEPAPPPAAEPVDKNDAEAELRRLMTAGDPAQFKVCYLLALLLERKRILKAREKIIGPDGSRMVIYEHTGTQETFMVREVDFKLSELDALREEVAGSASQLFAKVSMIPENSSPPA